ncbi:hypothetical protein N7467_008043 [Penicillium canescens]|nr:hypothetical protein N7467_008043 [Penicillium canescens]
MDADYNSGLEAFAKQTKTVCGLAGKSPTAVRSILQNPNVKVVVNYVLSVTAECSWGDAHNKCVSPPLLSSFFMVRVGPGSPRQASKVTKENGATEIVLNSHVWDDERKPAVEELAYGEMDVGESLLILGNRCHGAGANVTADCFRSVVVTLFCKGVYRLEENKFLAVTADQANELPHDVQDLLR